MVGASPSLNGSLKRYFFQSSLLVLLIFLWKENQDINPIFYNKNVLSKNVQTIDLKTGKVSWLSHIQNTGRWTYSALASRRDSIFIGFLCLNQLPFSDLKRQTILNFIINIFFARSRGKKSFTEIETPPQHIKSPKQSDKSTGKKPTPCR